MTDAFKSIPDDWKEWMADCLMMQVSDADIVKFMTAQGFDEDVVAKEVEQAATHPYIIAGTKLARQMKRRDWLLRLYQMLSENSGQFEEIERRETITREEFYKHYHCTNRPIILTKMNAHWKILQDWSPEYFKSKYGEREVQVVHMDEHFKKSHVHMTMAEYVDTISAGESNSWYMTNSNTDFNETTILDLYQEVEFLPELLDPEGDHPHGYLLFGPSGTITDLHFDLANAIYCQVHGRKHFQMVSPIYLPNVYPYRNFLSKVDLEHGVDLEKFPLFARAKVYDFILEPGEILFLPIGWWHFVRSIGVSMSLSFANFYTKEGYFQYQDLYGTHPLIDD